MLDVVIGLSVIYLLLSVVCSAVNELLASLLNGRGKHLERGVAQLIGDPKLQQDFYSHPMIKALGDGKRLPSYIPSSTFASVLVDVIAPAWADWTRTGPQIAERIDRLPDGSALRHTLNLFMDRVGADVDKLHREIETWFDQAMARVSGWYKRTAQVTLLVIALVVVVAANADTLRLTRVLSTNPAQRAALVSYAQSLVTHPPSGIAPAAGEGAPAGATRDSAVATAAAIDSAAAHLVGAIGRVESLGLPLGWTRPPASLPEGINIAIGLLISTFAVGLGSPFWFDVLGRLVNVRAAGPQPRAVPQPAEGK